VVGQPMVYCKNMLQQGIRPSANPLHWYRGYVIHASSMVPITAMQMWSNNVIARMLTGGKPELASDVQKSIAAVGAGAFTSTVASPSELVILYQQNAGTSLLQAAKDVYRRYGMAGYLRGMPLVATRDGIFTFGYLNLGPRLQSFLAEKFGSGAGFLGSLGVGMVVGIVTHPVDTVKTEVMRPEKAPGYNMFHAYRDVARQGTSAFFKGVAPRTLRIMASVLLYSNLSEWMDRFRPGRRAVAKKVV